MRQKKTLVIFDFDGVIVKDCHQRNMLMQEWGIWKIAKLYLDDFNGKEKEVAASKTKEIGMRTLHNLVLKKDALNLINFLDRKKECRKAILSLNSRSVIEAFLSSHALLNKFDMIVGVEDVRRLKPYPEGLIKIMNTFGVSRRETLYIGDSILDFLAGMVMRIDTVQSIKEAKRFLGIGTVAQPGRAAGSRDVKKYQRNPSVVRSNRTSPTKEVKNG